jgi:hypothetical protein
MFLLTFIGQEHFVFWNTHMHLSSSQHILRMYFAVIVVKIWSGQVSSATSQSKKWK